MYGMYPCSSPGVSPPFLTPPSLPWCCYCGSVGVLLYLQPNCFYCPWLYTCTTAVHLHVCCTGHHYFCCPTSTLHVQLAMHYCFYCTSLTGHAWILPLSMSDCPCITASTVHLRLAMNAVTVPVHGHWLFTVGMGLCSLCVVSSACCLVLYFAICNVYAHNCVVFVVFAALQHSHTASTYTANRLFMCTC